jgi:hypothetical protein
MEMNWIRRGHVHSRILMALMHERLLRARPRGSHFVRGFRLSGTPPLADRGRITRWCGLSRLGLVPTA